MGRYAESLDGSDKSVEPKSYGVVAALVDGDKDWGEMYLHLSELGEDSSLRQRYLGASELKRLGGQVVALFSTSGQQPSEGLQAA